MTRKTLRISTAVISVVLALVVGWSITAGNFAVPILDMEALYDAIHG